MIAANVDLFVKTAFVVCAVIAFVVDTILLFIFAKLNSQNINKYYEFCNKIGLIKSTVLKFAVIIWLIYSLLFEPSGKSGSIFSIITAYSILVTKFIIDYKKAKVNRQQDV